MPSAVAHLQECVVVKNSSDVYQTSLFVHAVENFPYFPLFWVVIIGRINGEISPLLRGMTGSKQKALASSLYSDYGAMLLSVFWYSSNEHTQWKNALFSGMCVCSGKRRPHLCLLKFDPKTGRLGAFCTFFYEYFRGRRSLVVFQMQPKAAQ